MVKILLYLLSSLLSLFSVSSERFLLSKCGFVKGKFSQLLIFDFLPSTTEVISEKVFVFNSLCLLRNLKARTRFIARKGKPLLDLSIGTRPFGWTEFVLSNESFPWNDP